MGVKMSLLVHGLTDEHKDFLYSYAERELGSRSRTKAILALINEKMACTTTFVPAETLTGISHEKPINDSGKKKRIQISLKEHDYNNLLKVCENTDTAPINYIIRLILNNIYSENIRLQGNEIENLKKSNYELHKIGVNLNQIAKAINSDEKVNFDLDKLAFELKYHINLVRKILSENLERY